MFQSRSRQPILQLGLLLTVLAASSAVCQGDLSEHYGFGSMEILKLDWEMGQLLTGDLNGDSLNDLVVCNNRKARIELLLQKAKFDPRAAEVAPVPEDEDINDLFGRETAWRFKRFQYPLHVRATSVVLGDFNHDQRPDLAFYSDEGLHIVLQDSSAKRDSETLSDPSWKVPTRLDLRDGIKTSDVLAAGDLNDDGRTDLVLLLQDGYYVLLQDSNGGMARPVRHYASSGGLRQVEVGDVDGDGRSDLVLLTGESDEYPVRIRLQSQDGNLGPEGRYSIPMPSVLRLLPMGDSGKQVVASISRQSGRFSLHSLVQADRQGEVVCIHPLPSDNEASKRDMTCADVDGDGRTDMVVTDPGRAQFLVLRGQADGGLAPATVYPGLKDMRKVCAARLGEGPGDALVVLSVDEKLIALSQFENGRLCFPRTVAVVGEPQALEVADLDQDGVMDLAYVAKGSPEKAGSFFLRSILAVGRPAARPGPSLELTGVDDKPQDLLICDIDHDRDADLIVVRSYDPLLLVRQTAPGVFERQVEDQAQVGLVGNLSPRAVSLAPLGPDGSAALLVARGEFARSLYFNADKGWQVIDQYQAGDARRQLQVVAAMPAPAGKTPSIVGYDDISGIVSFMDRQADGTYRVDKEINVGTAPVRKILTGRFGANSAQDLVLCADQKLICLRTGAQAELRQIATFETDIEGGRFGYFTMGDVNSNGVPDIVLCEHGRHHVQILSFDEGARLTDACKFKVFETHAGSAERQPGRGSDSGEPRHVLIQDVTGDGRNDVVVLVHDRIIVYPQD